MKHNYYLLLATMLVTSGAFLTGCSSENDEPVPGNVAGNAISFSAVSQLSQKRAVDATTASLNQFFVYGYLNSTGATYFDNVEVNKSSSNVWEYSPLKYWPAFDSVNFYAYAPAGWVPSSGPLSSFSYSVGPWADDLIYAVALDKSQPAVGQDAQVRFNFRHALSKVSVNMSSTESTLVAKVSNVQIIGVNQTGDFTFPTASTDAPVATAEANSIGTWTNLKDKGVGYIFIAQTPEEAVTLTSTPTDLNSEGTFSKFYIPQALPFMENPTVSNSVYLRIALDIYDAQTGQKVWPNSNTNPDNIAEGSSTGHGQILLPLTGSGFTAWKSGYHYIYNVVINAHPDMSSIQFGDPTVDSFVNVTTQLQ